MYSVQLYLFNQFHSINLFNPVQSWPISSNPIQFDPTHLILSSIEFCLIQFNSTQFYLLEFNDFQSNQCPIQFNSIQFNDFSDEYFLISVLFNQIQINSHPQIIHLYRRRCWPVYMFMNISRLDS